MFRQNVGGMDKVLRLTLGGILFFAGLILLIGRTTLGITLVVVGLLALLTGIVRFCVLYIPFEISTARPGGHSPRQVCDCASWMKAIQNNRTANPSAPAENGVADAVTSARDR